MSREILLVQVLIASFFAIGFLRAHGPFNLDERISVGGIFRLPGRLERLRRSRAEPRATGGAVFHLSIPIQQQVVDV